MTKLNWRVHPVFVKARHATICDLASEEKYWMTQTILHQSQTGLLYRFIRSDTAATINRPAGICAAFRTCRLHLLFLLIQANGTAARVVIVEAAI